MILTYWLTTGLLSSLLSASAASYIFSSSTIEGVRALGFPDFFRVELAILKMIAAIALILPHTPYWIKEWAYAGTALFLITAIVAHYVHQDPPFFHVINMSILGLLIVSRISLSNP